MALLQQEPSNGGDEYKGDEKNYDNHDV